MTAEQLLQSTQSTPLAKTNGFPCQCQPQWANESTFLVCEALQSVKQSTGKGFQSWLCRLLQSIVRLRTASSSPTIPLELEPNDSHLVLPLRIFTSATFLREDWVCGDFGLRSQVSVQQTDRETLQALSVHVGLSPLKDNTHSSRESA